MTVALALLAYGGLLATLGTYGLRRVRWLDRGPLLGIVVWLSLSAAVLVSVVLAGAALTVPTPRVSGGLAELLRACGMALRARYAAPGGPGLAAGLGVAGAALALAVLVRVGSCLVVAFVRAGVERVRQRQALALVGRVDRGVGPVIDPTIDTVVVEHETAAAYCLPGRRQRIVLSTAALTALSGEQLQAVLAHERAHLRGRHDLAIAAALALARAFPGVPVFQVAKEEVVGLVELRADDVAGRTTRRLILAEALLALGGAAQETVPAIALAAGGSTTARRVHRLIAPHRPLGNARTGLCLLIAAAFLAVPLLLLAGPAATAAHAGHCPLGRPCHGVSTSSATGTATGTPRAAPMRDASSAGVSEPCEPDPCPRHHM